MPAFGCPADVYYGDILREHGDPQCLIDAQMQETDDPLVPIRSLNTVPPPFACNLKTTCLQTVQHEQGLHRNIKGIRHMPSAAEKQPKDDELVQYHQ